MNRFATTSFVAAVASTVFAYAASAATVDVLPTSTLWTNPTDENSGGGISGVQATPLLDGDGAVFIKGDRTRFATGTIYPGVASTSLGLLSDLTAYDMKWTGVTKDPTTTIPLADGVALRLHIYSPTTNRRYEIIWEDGEQGANSQFAGNPTAVPGTTLMGNMFTSSVYVNTRSGPGTGRGLFDSSGNFISGSDAPTTIADLKSLLGPDAFIGGLSLGAGSSAGSLFTAYADDVHIAFGAANDTVYNFTTVPEPTTFAMVGLGVAGLLLRRRRAAR